MGKPKAKLTPARACGSERNVSPAIKKARTTSFFIIKETRNMYPRIQESKRGKSLSSKVIVFPSESARGSAARISTVLPNSCILRRQHIARHGAAPYFPTKESWAQVSLAANFLHQAHASETGPPIERTEIKRHFRHR